MDAECTAWFVPHLSHGRDRAATSREKAPAANSPPVSSADFEPKRRSMRPVNWPTRTIVTVDGAR